MPKATTSDTVPSGYAELCTTTNFTFLTGASHPEEMVTRAAELGLAAIAITDRNSLAAVVRAYSALKVLRQDSPSLRRRLIREGRLAARIWHPNVVRVVRLVTVDGKPGLVLEFVDGPPLDVVLSRGSLSFAQIDELARGILAGVIAAHERGLVHRDLKPGNVMLALGGEHPIPRINDFGLGKAIAEGSEPNRPLRSLQRCRPSL